MKRGELNALARSLGEYLGSRNNDISGYWGIGFLCLAAKSEHRHQFSFRIRPGLPIRIASRELSESQYVTDKLVNEAPRVCRRLHSVRGWSHAQTVPFFPRSA
jgi:hypothetical protein